MYLVWEFVVKFLSDNIVVLEFKFVNVEDVGRVVEEFFFFDDVK